MKRLLLILPLMFSCSKTTPSFLEGEYESTVSAPVELNAQLSRDRTISIPMTIDSGVILIPRNNRDTTAQILSFELYRWHDVIDQEDLQKKVKRVVGLSGKELSDIVITMPRITAEEILQKLKR